MFRAQSRFRADSLLVPGLREVGDDHHQIKEMDKSNRSSLNSDLNSYALILYLEDFDY
jgi:hypothetical protein